MLQIKLSPLAMGSPTQSVIINVTRDISAWAWKLAVEFERQVFTRQ